MNLSKSGRRIPVNPRGTIEQRLAAAVQIDPIAGCHEWQKSRQARGYGVIYYEGKLHLAHRVAFFLKHGRWPAESVVTDHICENKGCVNADHLRELTNSENIRRAYRHLDPELEPERARQRVANAKYRSTQKGGESLAVVQD